jgi:Mrp family chromosome partitioning ATPase
LPSRFQLQPTETEALRVAGSVNLRALENPSLVDWSPDRALASDIYGFNSIDPRSRSFNLVRGRLLKLKRERDFRIIGVVSATPNVGKSFVSANISASLSRDPQINTFAVDLDLRRGSLSNRFGLIPDDGLSDHLSAGTPLRTFRLQGENLTLIPTKGGMVHSAELLASARAQALFAAMQDSDDSNLFICDLPPVFANDDAVAAMAHLSGYILVSEEGRTTEREIKDAVMALGRERLAGVVLNKFRGGVVSDGYGVDSYYAQGYGLDPDTSPKDRKVVLPA